MEEVENTLPNLDSPVGRQRVEEQNRVKPMEDKASLGL